MKVLLVKIKLIHLVQNEEEPKDFNRQNKAQIIWKWSRAKEKARQPSIKGIGRI